MDEGSGGGAGGNAGGLPNKMLSKQKKSQIRLPWEIEFMFNEQPLEANDDAAVDEEEREAVLAQLKRLKQNDERTKHMTQKEYVHWSDCRQASFTFRKAKRFREWCGLSQITESRPNDDVIDILGFLTFEMVCSITEEALKLKKSSLQLQSQEGETKKRRYLFDEPSNDSKPIMVEHVQEAWRNLQQFPTASLIPIMSQGTLYAADQTRCIFPRGLVKVLDLDVKVEATAENYGEIFPLKKYPAFVGPNGFKIHEVIAIVQYRAPLLGKNTKEYTLILQWMSFGTTDFVDAVVKVFLPLIGRVPYNKKSSDEGYAQVEKYVGLLEKRLRDFTYLVGEKITAADLFFATCFLRPFQYMYGDDWRKKHPILMRWFTTVSQSPYLSWFKFELAEKPTLPPKPQKKVKGKKHNQAPKEKAPKSDKKAAKVEKKVEAAPAEPKKPKHPLEPLGRSKIPIDEWKRKYSNEDTRKVALPYFWNEFYNDEEWSLWKITSFYQVLVWLCCCLR
ncbi:unnamed protein product [Ambrosiozyma monospora]|uniref:Unnamed protein product n=1 Tax=Ambrosiozyma monospora TaxID=43982 RepID=A0ACB5T4F0_AMBMO|nr:unnamed protein product [Ambrosiozyma monospora]